MFVLAGGIVIRSLCVASSNTENERPNTRSTISPSYLLKISLANNNENRKESLLMPTESLQHTVGPNLEMPLETLFD